MKYREVQEQLRLVGIMISKRGDSLRVNHFSGGPETAYVTSDLEEALRAGLTMARPKTFARELVRATPRINNRWSRMKTS